MFWKTCFLAPASPSFSPGAHFRWEEGRRRVRVFFGGMAVADSRRVMLLHEFGALQPLCSHLQLG